MGWIAAAAVIAAGTGILVWIATGRIMEQVDRLPNNTPEAFRQELIAMQTGMDDAGVDRSGDADPRIGARERRVGPRVVVCMGDSITQGSISSNYVDTLASRFNAREYQFVNAGINGDLAYNVMQRLGEVIECKPDVVTILVGTNDANALTNRSNLKRYIKEQHLPQTPTEEWYRQNLEQIVTRLQEDTDAEIVLLSIPPIGEATNHPAFRRSQAYGTIAKEVAHAAGVAYLPLGEAMVARLDMHAGNPMRSAHRLRTHKRSAVVDLVLRRFVLKQTYAAVSRSNGHTLLTDHLHLNDTGAELVADAIEGYLRKNGGSG